MTNWEAEAIHWKQESELLRTQLQLTNDTNASLRGQLAETKSRLTLLESALRSVGRTACNYVDITKQ